MNGIRYPSELREDAIRLYQEGEISAAAVARQMGLKVFTVKEWLSKAGVIRTMGEAAAISVRQAPRGHRGSKIAWTSAKTGRQEIADSTYEAARMKQLDDDPSVLDWRRCTDRLPYLATSGKLRFYIPDLIVVRESGATVEEVKPARFVTAPENQMKFAAAREYYSRLRIAFMVITEEELGGARDQSFPAYRPDNEERRMRHLRKTKERRKSRMAAESPEQRLARLQHDAAKARRLRAGRVESPERAELRRQKQREATARMFARETPEKREERLAVKAARARDARQLAKGRQPSSK